MTTCPSSLVARVQHFSQQLHNLGPRATYQLMLELVAGAPVLPRLERYARLDARVVRDLGADAMPARFTVLDGGLE
jgi:hypothetical protein